MPRDLLGCGVEPAQFAGLCEAVRAGQGPARGGADPVRIRAHASIQCRRPIQMSPFSPFEMSLSRVTDPPKRGRATPTSSAALLSARVSNGEEGRARYPAHE